MAYTPEQIQRAMRAALLADDQAAVDDLRQRLTEAYEATSPKATEGMSGIERFAAGVGQGVTNVGRQLQSLVGARSPEEAAEQARLDRDLLATGAGRAGAFTGEVLATAPVGGVAAGAGRALATRAGLGTAGRVAGRLVAGNAGQGAAEGALMSEGDRLRGAAAGAAGGAILPWAGGKLLRGVSRGIQATPAARRLMNEGVELTPGQMNPDSAIGQLEEAATNVWGIGPMISRAREGAKQEWQRAARRKALPPGVKPSEANGSIESVYAQYEPAYDKAKGFPLRPAVMREAGGDLPLASFPQVRGTFKQAAYDQSVFADDTTRKAVDGWLQNKLTALPGAGRGPDPIDSADLLKLRSEIRDQIRKLRSGRTPNEAAADLFGNAEKSVTEVLESQLPTATTRGLQATDAQYAQYKILEDALRRAGDQAGGLTPSQLSAAVKQATPAGAYARGAGGPLRKLAASGKSVFDQRTPPTGARLATLATAVGLGAAFPKLMLPVAGGVVLGSSTKVGRRVLGGVTKPQQKLLATTRALRRKAGRVIRPTTVAAGAAGANEYLED